MPTTHFIVPKCHEDVAVLYQDDEMIMVNKPSSLLSVPGRHPENQDCVVSRIQQTLPNAKTVHRLDMDTSGVMVLALTPESHRALNRQFEQRLVHKHYEAVVFGHVANDQGSVDAPLGCDWPNRPKQKVDYENGKSALTHYEVISREHDARTPFLLSSNSHQDLHMDSANAEAFICNYTRLLLKPVTGRSHQLRVHLAQINHPILGCEFYAHKQAFNLSSRLLLHATYLSVIHPTHGQRIEIHSPAPF